MMRFATISLVLSLLAAPLAAQNPADRKPKDPANKPALAKPAPGSLEDVIDQALKNNAEIRAAEAKVRQAEADLQQVRMAVLQKVTAAKFKLDQAKMVSEVAKQYYDQLSQVKTAASSEVRKAHLDWQRAHFDAQQIEAELNTHLNHVPGQKTADLGLNPFEPAITWLQPDRRSTFYNSTIPTALFLPDGTLVWTAPPTVQFFNTISMQPPNSVTERVRTALDVQIKMEAPKEPLPLAETLDYLKKKAGIDVPIRVLAPPSTSIELMAGELPLGAWLQAVEDSAPDIAIAVREYGILVTKRDRLPRDAELVRDFWRRARAEQAKEKEKAAPMK